jgi:hypothetical protein
MFQVLDQRGVGELIKLATERGRKARPNLKVSLALVNICILVVEILFDRLFWSCL